MSLTDDIKDFALGIGYHAVGIATAEPFRQLKSALEERGDDYASFGRLRQAVDPRNNLAEARSIVVCIYDYFTEGFPEGLNGKLSRAVQARCFMASANRLHMARLHLMHEFLDAQGCQVGPTQSSAIAERQAAARAGLGQFGRNSLLSVPGRGSFVMIQSFVVDAELEYDAPREDSHCPPGCRLCREACPTGAIVEDFRITPARCISNISGFGTSPFVPRDIREKMGTWICGCDVCQEVCPRNQAKLKLNAGARLPINPYLAKKAGEFDLVAVLRLDEEYHARVVQPLVGHFVRDRRLLRRFAAIALGNKGDLAAVRPLAEALYDPDVLVRAHAAWALGQLGGARARMALECALRQETDEAARREIEEALDTFGNQSW